MKIKPNAYMKFQTAMSACTKPTKELASLSPNIDGGGGGGAHEVPGQLRNHWQLMAAG